VMLLYTAPFSATVLHGILREYLLTKQGELR
jgi:branched-subunit amino acid aminotransferase/4-amino-4-deoxychorismate lyase